MKLIVFKALLLTLLVSTLGCDANDNTDTAETYRLASINNNGLPVLVQTNDGFELWIRAETLTFDDDGTFDSTTSLRRVIDGETSEAEQEGTGTWVRNGDIVTVTFDQGGNWELTLSGDSMTRPGNCYLTTVTSCPRVYLKR